MVSLLKTVQDARAGGSTEEQVYSDLLKKGHTVAEIRTAWTASNATYVAGDVQKKTISTLLFIGAVLVGAGVFSFVAANWSAMSDSAKILVIIVGMLGFYGAGYVVENTYKLERTASMLYLVGALIFGAGIFLIAQIYNVRANWPDGLVLWMLGLIPLVLSQKKLVLWYLLGVLAAASVVTYPEFLFDVVLFESVRFATSAVILLCGAAGALFVGDFIHKHGLQ